MEHPASSDKGKNTWIEQRRSRQLEIRNHSLRGDSGLDHVTKGDVRFTRKLKEPGIIRTIVRHNWNRTTDSLMSVDPERE